MSTGRFQKLPSAHKFVIGSIPEPSAEEITVEAQYNPKDLQIDSPIGWQEHKAISEKSLATKVLEFTGMGCETIKVELLFDAFEEDNDFVVESIARLKRMAGVRVPNKVNADDPDHRPSFCVATWGTQEPFRCVIDSINVKYTMFSTDGTPVRATVVVGLKSGQRTLSTSESTFEKASTARLEAQRAALKSQRKDEYGERDKREAQRKWDEKQREQQRFERSKADRELATRERQIADERAQLEAARRERERQRVAAADRADRERRIAESERELKKEREAEAERKAEEERAAKAEAERQRLREQRKKDFDLE